LPGRFGHVRPSRMCSNQRRKTGTDGFISAMKGAMRLAQSRRQQVIE
jgi:hypothetical protein